MTAPRVTEEQINSGMIEVPVTDHDGVPIAIGEGERGGA